MFSQWYTVQSLHGKIFYYDASHEYLVPHLVRCFENSLSFHRSLFDYTPTEDIVISMEDFDDYGYGGASSLPFNNLHLGIEPYKYDYETSPTNERFNWVMNHELTHIVASDKAARSDQFFRSLFFGKVSPTPDDPLSVVYSYLTSPRKYAPRWYHEGIAVFLETWMSGGIGRALGGYDEMVFRAMVRDNAYMYDVVGLESEGTTIDFQVGANSYLYGTRFVSYLALTYGPEKLLQWFNRTDTSDRYFGSQFERVYGISLDGEWSKWITWEKGFQRANLDSIRQFPVTHYRTLSPRALGSVSRSFYDSTRRVVYAAINYPGQLAQIASIDIDNGTIKKIADMPTPALYYVADLAYDPVLDQVFYTTNNARGWRDLNMVDLATGQSSRLLRGVRIGDLACDHSDHSIYAVQHHNGISTIVRIEAPYTSVTPVMPLDYGKDIFDLDISPDGKYLIGSLIEISGRQRLIRLALDSLQQRVSSFETLLSFDNNTSPENFVYSRDGKYLYGTSYYSGVSNVFRYDLTTRHLDAISNCETGFFRPMPLRGDSVIVFHYTGRGFVPVMIPDTVYKDLSAIQYLGEQIVERHPIVKDWKIGSPLRINTDSVIVSRGEYDNFAAIRLASLFPIVEGYKNDVAYGVRFNFLDPMQTYNFNVNTSISPNKNLPENQRFHASLKFSHWPWKINSAYNDADFYDLFGPTKTSRKGFSLGVQYSNNLILDIPKRLDYQVSANAYTGLDQLPDYQNVAVSYDNFFTLRGGLQYQSLRRSLGAVEYEEGVTWGITSFNTLARSILYPKFYMNLDYGFLLPFDHSSVWLRSSTGYSIGHQQSIFSYFYFGGFGNNWIDYQDERRFREYYSFPGVALDNIGGTDYLKLLLEWDTPPIRYRRFGIPNVYCTWSRFVFFTSSLVTQFDNRADRGASYDVGSQLDFNLVIFSRLESTISVGYAFAFQLDQRSTREFMLSLKILK